MVRMNFLICLFLQSLLHMGEGELSLIGASSQNLLYFSDASSQGKNLYIYDWSLIDIVLMYQLKKCLYFGFLAIFVELSNQISNFS